MFPKSLYIACLSLFTAGNLENRMFPMFPKIFLHPLFKPFSGWEHKIRHVPTLFPMFPFPVRCRTRSSKIQFRLAAKWLNILFKTALNTGGNFFWNRRTKNSVVGHETRMDVCIFHGFSAFGNKVGTCQNLCSQNFDFYIRLNSASTATVGNMGIWDFLSSHPLEAEFKPVYSFFGNFFLFFIKLLQIHKIRKKIFYKVLKNKFPSSQNLSTSPV